MKYFIALLLVSSIAEAQLDPWEVKYDYSKQKPQQMSCTCTFIEPEQKEPIVDEEKRKPQQDEDDTE